MTSNRAGDGGSGLAAQAPVASVAAGDSFGTLGIGREPAAELRQRAVAFMDQLASAQPGSPAFTAQAQQLSAAGVEQVRAVSNVSARVVTAGQGEVPLPGMAVSSAVPLADQVGAVLQQLATLVDRVLGSPQSGLKRLFGLGKNESDPVAELAAAENELQHILDTLSSSQDALFRENAQIQVEFEHLWRQLQDLGEYAHLMQALSDEGNARARQVAGTSGEAAWTQDVVFPVTQRHQDLLTQLAIGIQGYLALKMIRANNEELIRGVQQAEQTTVAALRTAVLASRASRGGQVQFSRIAQLNSKLDGLADVASAASEQMAAANAGDTEGLRDALRRVQVATADVQAFQAVVRTNTEATVSELSLRER